MPDSPDPSPELSLVRRCPVPDHERRNLRLRPLLLDMAARIADKGTNAAAGPSYFSNKWLSARDLHLLPDPEMDSLVTFIEDEANRLPWPGRYRRPGRLRIHAMWAIVSRQGMEGRPHQHSSRVSGAYYVDAGDCGASGSGDFAVYSQEGRLTGTVTPAAGLMLLFPSGLWHGVLRYESERPRIVLSFNLIPEGRIAELGDRARGST